MRQITINEITKEIAEAFAKNPEVYGTALLAFHDDLERQFAPCRDRLSDIPDLRRRKKEELTEEELRMMSNRQAAASLAIVRDVLLYIMSGGTAESIGEALDDMSKGVSLGMKLAEERGILDRFKSGMVDNLKSAKEKATS